jgi:hypothetical protein
MKTKFQILILILVCSCSSNKKIDFGEFEIEVPKKWNRYDQTGTDSYVGGFITNHKDTLIFDLGRYSQDLIKSDFPMVYDSIRLVELTKKELELLPKTKHLIVDTLPTDINYQDYLQYQFKEISIDCFQGKLIEPRNSDFGGSGIYIDSIKGSDKNRNKISFNFYGWYLNNETKRKFFKSLKTIKFKEEYCHKND